MNKVLPFYYSDVSLPMRRLIIKPNIVEETQTTTGLLIPAHEIQESEVGIVQSTCEGSDFQIGDEVQYRKQDRATNEYLETIFIDGDVCDVVYEHKISARNNRPYNQVFVKPMSEMNVSQGGLVIPTNVQSVTRKGVIFDAPDYFMLKKGDQVEYFNQVQNMYPQVNIDGDVCEALWESDIYMVNGEVAPHRILVKIDLVAQHLKRSSTHSGLRLSPLFIHMLRNLQYAEIVGIGCEAQKKYPDLAVGDTIVIDHAVESQDWRLIKADIGKEGHAIYDYRIINCYDFSEREIFAKLFYNKENNKIIDIIPMLGSIFLKWEFEHFELSNSESGLILSDDSLTQYRNIPDLKNVVDHRRKEAAQKAKLATSSLKMRMSQINPQEHPSEWAQLSSALAITERQEKKIAIDLRKDYWVVCETTYPRQTPAYMVSPYEELYPINILGKKFLIGHEDFLLFQTHKNMDITSADLKALLDTTLILPIEEEKGDSELIIPNSAREKPQYGKVIQITNHPDGVKNGDIVLFRQHAGLQQKVDGVDHLIMKHNDLLMVVPAKETSI